MPDQTTPSSSDPTNNVASGSIAVESILPASTGDSATRDDSLGFEPYVNAIAEFLTNPSTHGPLTVSIEGEWGSGKSSFLLQLEDRLGEIAARDEHQRHRVPLTVRFNAWRHDKEDALWAAFATQFARSVAAEQPLYRRIYGHWILFRRRFRWRQGWPGLLRTIFSAVFTICVLAVLTILCFRWGWHWIASLSLKIPGPTASSKDWLEWSDWLTGFGRAGLLVGYLTVLASGWTKISQYLRNPLETDIKKYLLNPDYAQRASFIEQFHEDFSRIIDAYAGDKTVYVFIDDLDRCEVSKAAELMQAINLMVSGDRRGLIFIIGMDRTKVAAGVAMRNKELLPFLYPNAGAGPVDNGATGIKGLQFGYEFIEKFIQIPFSVPVPDTANVKQLLGAISRSDNRAKANRISILWHSAKDWVLGSSRVKRTPTTQAQTAPATNIDKPKQDIAKSDIESRQRIKLEATGDSEAMRNIVIAMAPFLGNNPRRIKQFINLFRLRIFIAAETGLFDGTECFTLEQLGKFVGISLVSPLLAGELENDPGLLNRLQMLALNEPADDVSPIWSRNQELIKLLQFGLLKVAKADRATSAWNLSSVPVEKVLRISRRVRTVELKVQSEVEQRAHVQGFEMTGQGGAKLGGTAEVKVHVRDSEKQIVASARLPLEIAPNSPIPPEYPQHPDQGATLAAMKGVAPGTANVSATLTSSSDAEPSDAERPMSQFETPERAVGDWQRIDSLLSPLNAELREAYQEALRILVRDGAASERFIRNEFHQKKLTINVAGIFSQMQSSTNLVQPVPGQPEETRAQNREWQIRPALVDSVQAYLQMRDSSQPA